MKRYILLELNVSRDVVYITIVPKKSGGGMRFTAGQYATLGFRGQNGRLTPMRCFSMTSSAAQTENLQFATRLGGDFTHALADLQIGDEIFIQGPYGEFVVNEQYDKHVVMIAGGIGVTPFMSIIRTATESHSTMPMTLLYSYRSGHNIPFHDELRQLEQRNPYLQIIIFVSDKTIAPNTPRMLSGRMTAQHINQITSGSYAGSTYFVCGPKGFMQATKTMLIEKNVRPDRILIESFVQSDQTTLWNRFNARKMTYAFASAVLGFGIISIASLDLLRYVPRHVSANASTTVQTMPNTNTGTSNGTTPSPSTTTTTPSASSSSTSNSVSNSQPTTYQQPVTSVS